MQNAGQTDEEQEDQENTAFATPRDKSSQFYTLEVRKT
jgi:hypothetical protein